VSATRTVQSPVVEAAEPELAGDVMPDLRGLSAREAVRTLTKLGMVARLTGDGFVIDQAPAAGTPLGVADACTLKLGRRVPAGAAGAPE
jgi:hypothetical protein